MSRPKNFNTHSSPSGRQAESSPPARQFGLANAATVGIAHDPAVAYPEADDYFSPDQAYPEYPFRHTSRKANHVYRMVRDLLRQMRLDEPRYGTPGWNPLGEWIRRGESVFALVNFVTERRPFQSADDFAAMVTHPSVIRPVLDYLMIATSDPQKVKFGNAPVQSARIAMIAEQTSAQCLREFYIRETSHDIGPHDLRLYISHVNALGGLIGSQELDLSNEITFDLGRSSKLSAADDSAATRFSVEDYGSDITRKFHSNGTHVYKIHRSVIEADVIFHICKLKTHGKVGLTGALKGAVGSITRKECLAHYRRGSAKQGYDEYKSNSYVMRLYEHLGDRKTQTCPNWIRITHKNLGRVLDRVLGVKIRGDWHGNDTAWRMVLDINRCLAYGRADGTISPTPVRRICSMVDGISAGEGDGPIHVSGRHDGLLLLSSDACAADYASAVVMGFDPGRIPLIRAAFSDTVYPLTLADLNQLSFIVNGSAVSAANLAAAVPAFKPPAGWRSHIERNA